MCIGSTLVHVKQIRGSSNQFCFELGRACKQSSFLRRVLFPQNPETFADFAIQTVLYACAGSSCDLGGINWQRSVDKHRIGITKSKGRLVNIALHHGADLRYDLGVGRAWREDWFLRRTFSVVVYHSAKSTITNRQKNVWWEWISCMINKRRVRWWRYGLT